VMSSVGAGVAGVGPAAGAGGLAVRELCASKGGWVRELQGVGGELPRGLFGVQGGRRWGRDDDVQAPSMPGGCAARPREGGRLGFYRRWGRGVEAGHNTTEGGAVGTSDDDISPLHTMQGPITRARARQLDL
jgi:hypothetical protein